VVGDPGHHWIVDWRQRTHRHGARARFAAFDVRTGKQAWKLDPLPRWSEERWPRRMLWSVIAADPERDLISCPPAAPVRISMGANGPAQRLCEFCRGDAKRRPCKVLWPFGGDHDLWDYDVASSPMR